VKGVPVDRPLRRGPLNPTVESHIPAVLESAGCPVPVIVTTWDEIGLGGAQAIYVVDGETRRMWAPPPTSSSTEVSQAPLPALRASRIAWRNGWRSAVRPPAGGRRS